MNIDSNQLLSLAWSQLWQMTAVIVAVAVIVRVFCRHRPHLAYLLWMLVIVKCLTPPVWSSPSGIFSWAQVHIPSDPIIEVSTNETVVLADTSPLDETDESLSTQTTPGEREHRSNEDPDVAANVPQSSNDGSFRIGSRWPVVLVSVWLAGSLAVLITAIRKRATCTRDVRRSSREADEALNSSLSEIAERLGVSRSARLLVTQKQLGPAVFGIWRPTILLPESLVEAKPLSELEPILAHELIHFRRGDPLVVLLQFSAHVFWWFHPLVWWASRETSRERERCCDEETVAGLPCEPDVYAQTLVDVLKQKRPLQPLFALPGMRTLEVTTRRLQHVMGEAETFHQRTPAWCWMMIVVAAAMLLPGGALVSGSNDGTNASIPRPRMSNSGEWNQFCGSSHRNNTPDGENMPTQWDVETAKNIRWSAKLGSSTYNSPVIAEGKVFMGTNNEAGYIKRYPPSTDLSCLLCFDDATGKFLWQYSIPKLQANEPFPRSRVLDWPALGLCSVPMVEGKRLWVVTTRCEVVCLDTDGFRDGNNDGPFKGEPQEGEQEADIIWKYDIMGRLGVVPHNLSNCSVTCAGDVLLVNTANGVDQSHQIIPAPDAPSFIALDRDTGQLLWKDASPGKNILHGQWSSPAYGVIDGVPQAIFAGGDGWLYSFDLRDIRKGKSNLLWWFDCNPKESIWMLGGRGTRNNILAAPTIYDGLVYISVGQDVEHGEGDGHLWCIDPKKRGDISAELVYNKRDPKTPIPHKRLQACETDKGDFVRTNPNSGVVWHYDKFDRNGDGSIAFEETMHRSVGTTTIKNDLLVVADTSGLVHCVDAKTGKVHWAYDMFAATWGTPLIVDGKIYIGDEDGDVVIFKLSKTQNVLAEIDTGSSIYGTPVSAGNSLYLGTKGKLYAIKSTELAADKTPSPRDNRSAATKRKLPLEKVGLPRELELKWKFDSKSGIESTPIISGDSVYVGDIYGRLYSLARGSGDVRWKFTPGNDFYASPAIHNNRLFIGDADGWFYCVDAKTGQEEWSFKTEGEINGAAGFWQDRVMIGSQDATLYSLDARRGELIWKFDAENQIRTQPAFVAKLVIVSGCHSTLFVNNVKTGKSVGTFDLQSPTISSPTVRDKHVYVGTEGGVMFCIDWETMREVWRFKTAGESSAIRSTPYVTDRFVIFGSRDKNVYALDRKTGKPVWVYKTRGRIDASPVVSGERVYIGSADGRVYVLNLMTGKAEWEYEIGGSIVSSVAIAEGVLVVGSDDGVVYCFGPKVNAR